MRPKFLISEASSRALWRSQSGKRIFDFGLLARHASQRLSSLVWSMWWGLFFEFSVPGEGGFFVMGFHS